MVATKPDDVVNGAGRLGQPVAVLSARSTVLRAGDPGGARAFAAEAERALTQAEGARGVEAARVEPEPATADAEREPPTPDVDGIRRANAARFEAAAQVQAERAVAQVRPDRHARAQAEADRAAAQTGAPGQPTAGADPASTDPSGRGPAGTGGTTGPEPAGTGPEANGRPALKAGTPPSPPSDPRTDVLRWFEDAFAGLRRDLREVVTGMTQQQAMIAELMDARQADLRLVVVAEGLPDVVQDAVEAAVAESTSELTESLDTALRDVRQSVKDTEISSMAAMVELRAAVETAERSTAAALEEARQLHDAAEQREALRARALKASITKQVRPLAEALQRAVDTTDRRMDGINARLDAMARPVSPTRSTATKKAATAKRAASVKKEPAKKAPAKRAAPAKVVPAKAAPSRARAAKRVLTPAPAPTPLAARRQPLRGLRTLQERG